MLAENNFSKYLIYAIGEILLVVVGILIALQIDTINEQRKDRRKEIHYLQNIKTDLLINISEMDKFIAIRAGYVESANIILAHFEGKPIDDLAEFNAHCISIYSWQKFYQNNNTFQELLNSGNLALISSDTIKTTLLNIELAFKVNKGEEEHFRFDSEEAIYRPLYSTTDINPHVQNFTYRMSNGMAGKNADLTEAYDGFLDNKRMKTGFVLASLEFAVLNEQLLKIKAMSEELIRVIDREIKRG